MSNSLSFLWIGALASLAASACSAGDVDTPTTDDSTTTLAQDARRAGPSYVTLRRDLRRCAAPLCGGFFVDAVNQDTLRCADGSRSAECYAFDLDLSALGLSAKQEQLIRDQPGTFLLQGTLRSRRT